MPQFVCFILLSARDSLSLLAASSVMCEIVTASDPLTPFPLLQTLCPHLLPTPTPADPPLCSQLLLPHHQFPSLSLLFLWLPHVACVTAVPWPVTEPGTAVKMQSSNHWTTRELPRFPSWRASLVVLRVCECFFFFNPSFTLKNTFISSSVGNGSLAWYWLLGWLLFPLSEMKTFSFLFCCYWGGSYL